MNASFRFSDPDAALIALADQLKPVVTGGRDALPGHVLADDIKADRPSPAADVSAMDGYAVRLEDLVAERPLSVSGESKAGSAPPPMTPGAVVRIFTGAIVPEGCEAIIKREDTVEEDTVESVPSIQLPQRTVDATQAGSHIRYCGENTAAGAIVLPTGTTITSAVVAALANFGRLDPTVYRPVRVAILTTGNEVFDPDVKTLEPWQLRNSNRAVLQAMLSSNPAVDLCVVEHVEDEPVALKSALMRSLEQADALFLTGGVSKGDYDYVPETIASAGGNVIFHGLPIRPGKPILGAATENGKLILGLPGNPVSASINCHRFGLPLIAKLAGTSRWNPSRPVVTLQQPPQRSIPLHTMPLVRLIDDGVAECVASKGSGDLVAMARSDGYIAVSPGATTSGPWPYFPW